MRYLSTLLCFILLISTLLSGCGRPAQPASQSAREEVVVMAADVAPREAPTVADPKAAIDEIYSKLDGCIVQNIGLERLKEIIGIIELPVETIYARYSDPKGGLADVIIAKPKVSSQIEVREALYRYRDRRDSEFENFDILNSLEIARGAIIFEHGEYIIMLMMADNDAAQAVIDQYIPL